MRRRNYGFEVLQVLISLGIIGVTVTLFFKSRELTILFPVDFGLAALLSLLYSFEGVLFNKSRVVRKTRIVLFLLLAVVFGFCTYVALLAVL